LLNKKEKLMKRLLKVGAIALLGGFFIFTLQTIAAVTNLEDLKLTVPDGVTKIRVISTLGDETIMNVKINVKPGQKFRFEVIE